LRRALAQRLLFGSQDMKVARTTTAALTSSGTLHHRERPILLLHGFLATARVVGWLADWLGRSGYCAHDVELGGLLGRFDTRPMEELARVLAQRVEQVARDHRCQRIDLVGHSAGGLIARYYIRRLEGVRRLRHLVTLGTPHRGTRWAYSGSLLGRVLPSLRQVTSGTRFLRDLTDDTFPREVRLTSIYSRCDLVCPASSCRLEARQGAHLKNIEVARGGHLEFLFSAEISSIVCRELESVEPPIPARPWPTGTGSFRPPATRAADGDRLPARPGEILAAQGQRRASHGSERC
jgi:triacylglycerol lipase